MRLVYCGIITFLEMVDTSFINAIIGKLAEVFGVRSAQLPALYLSLAVGACAALPLAKYCYRCWDLLLIYRLSIILLGVDFLWAVFTANWQVFVILRLIQGFLLTLLYALSFLDVVNHSQQPMRDINLINTIAVIGSIAGPVLGGLITLFRWNYIFALFALIMLFLGYLSRKITPKHGDASPLMRLIDAAEYSAFVLLLVVLSLILEGQLNICYLLLALILLAGLVLKYSHYASNFIFNKQVFNLMLLRCGVLHSLCRLSLIGLTPLLTAILYQYYAYTPLQISLLMSVSGIAALLAKFSYRLPVVNQASPQVLLVIYMGVLCLLALSLFQHKYFMLGLWGLFGFSTSLVFDYLNGAIFKGQDSCYHDDLAIILTILQMLLYGASITIVFKIFAALMHYYTLTATMALLILLMVYAVAVASYLWRSGARRIAN